MDYFQNVADAAEQQDAAIDFGFPANATAAFDVNGITGSGDEGPSNNNVGVGGNGEGGTEVRDATEVEPAEGSANLVVYRVARRHLSGVSPIFKTLLEGLPENPDGGTEVTLAINPEDILAMDLAMQMSHGCMTSLPEDLGWNDFVRLVRLLKEYQMIQIIAPFSDAWLQKAVRPGGAFDMLWVDMELGCRNQFMYHLEQAVQDATSHGEGLVLDAYGREPDSYGLDVPLCIVDAVAIARLQLIRNICKAIKTFASGVLAERKCGCHPFNAGACQNNRIGQVFRVATWAGACDMIFGVDEEARDIAIGRYPYSPLSLWNKALIVEPHAMPRTGRNRQR